MPRQFVHGGLRDPGLEEISVQPDLDTLEFADLDNFLDLAEEKLFRSYQNGIGCVRVQQIRQDRDRELAGVEAGRHGNLAPSILFQRLIETVHFAVAANQNNPAACFLTRHSGPDPQTHEFFLKDHRADDHRQE